MKKVLGILLGICVAAPVMAASVSEINKDAYMHHIKEMGMMRKHILGLMNKENKTAEETNRIADFSDFNTEDITFTYCTEFIISRENKNDPDKLREFLSSLGDSLVLVDDDEIIKVHVHTNDPGVALQEALRYGSFVTVKIENMRLQHTEKVMTEQEKALNSWFLGNYAQQMLNLSTRPVLTICPEQLGSVAR